jgi:hypothetical protein
VRDRSNWVNSPDGIEVEVMANRRKTFSKGPKGGMGPAITTQGAKIQEVAVIHEGDRRSPKTRLLKIDGNLKEGVSAANLSFCPLPPQPKFVLPSLKRRYY